MTKLSEDAPVNTCSGVAVSAADIGVSPSKQGKTIINKRKNPSSEGTNMNVFKKVYEDLKLTEATKPVQKDQPQQPAPLDRESLSNGAASELFARCRALATVTHFAHLSTDSYSEHQALATFYDDIISKVDAFCESFIGKYGKFISLPEIPTTPQLAHDAIVQTRDWIDQNRQLISDDSSLQNLIDEIVELINVTVYKLEKLK